MGRWQVPGRLQAIEREWLFVDLAAVVVLEVLAIVVVLHPLFEGSPVRILLVVPMVVFLPGYVVLASLFPPRWESSGDARSTAGSITWSKRLVLSVGVSMILAPLYSLFFVVTPVRMSTISLTVLVSVLTLGATVTAVVRRRTLPVQERFQVARLAAARPAADSRIDVALNVLLLASLIAAIASVGFVVMESGEAERFTELSLQTADGERLIASDYPRTMTRGDPHPLVVGIENREGRSITYSGIIKLQRLNRDDGSLEVVEEQELTRYRTRVQAGDGVHRTVSLRPGMTGDRLRLVVLIYRGAPTDDPSIATAYRETHLWVSVESATR